MAGAEGRGDGAASHGICRACLQRLSGDAERIRAEAASAGADRDGASPTAAEPNLRSGHPPLQARSRPQR